MRTLDAGAWMRAALDRINAATLAVAAVSLLGMAAVEGWQVWARYVLNASPGWTEPVALLLMNTAMMLGAAVAVRNEQHFGFTLAVDAFSDTWRRRARCLSALIMAAIGLALANGGARLALEDWDVATAGAAMPEGLRYLPLCVGGLLIALFAAERCVRVALGKER